MRKCPWIKRSVGLPGNTSPNFKLCIPLELSPNFWGPDWWPQNLKFFEGFSLESGSQLCSSQKTSFEHVSWGQVSMHVVLKAQLERQRLGQHPLDTLVDAACRPEALDLIFPPQWPPLESSSAKFSTQAAAHFYKESFIGIRPCSLFMVTYGCFYATMTELNSCHRN